MAYHRVICIKVLDEEKKQQCNRYMGGLEPGGKAPFKCNRGNCGTQWEVEDRGGSLYYKELPKNERTEPEETISRIEESIDAAGN